MAAFLIGMGADPTAVTGEDRALGDLLNGAAAPSPGDGDLDEMLDMAIQGGHLDAVTRLLDAGALVDGAPGSGHPPLGHAAWRGHAAIVRELSARGARLTFDGAGSALGAAFHGSRHCQDPEGGETMQTIDEVSQARYAEVVKLVLDAGAPVPRRLWDGAPSPATFIAELGLEIS